MLELNYFYRSKFAAKRYLLYPIFIQAIGVVLFVIVAELLFTIGLSMMLTITITALLSAVYVASTLLHLHRRDMNLIALGVWPLDVMEGTYQLIAKYDETIEELKSLQWRVQKLLVRTLQLRKEAQAHQAIKLARGIEEDYGRVLRLRSDILESIATAQENRKELTEIIGRIEDNRELEHEYVSLFSELLSSDRNAKKELERREQDVVRRNASAARRLGMS